MGELTIDRYRFDDALVVALVERLQAEFVKRYGGPDRTPLGSGTFEDPTGMFFLGVPTGDSLSGPVAMGGWRLRPDVAVLGGQCAAEIKRMYVVPAAQGRGYARAMLAHLERTAAHAGADVMVLETGMEQPEAIGLYRSCGYSRLDERFGLYRDEPSVRYFGKRLPRDAAGVRGGRAGSAGSVTQECPDGAERSMVVE